MILENNHLNKESSGEREETLPKNTEQVESFEEVQEIFQKEIDQSVVEFKSDDKKVVQISDSIKFDSQDTVVNLKSEIKLNETLNNLNNQATDLAQKYETRLLGSLVVLTDGKFTEEFGHNASVDKDGYIIKADGTKTNLMPSMLDYNAEIRKNGGMSPEELRKNTQEEIDWENEQTKNNNVEKNYLKEENIDETSSFELKPIEMTPTIVTQNNIGEIGEEKIYTATDLEGNLSFEVKQEPNKQFVSEKLAHIFTNTATVFKSTDGRFFSKKTEKSETIENNLNTYIGQNLLALVLQSGDHDFENKKNYENGKFFDFDQAILASEDINFKELTSNLPKYQEILKIGLERRGMNEQAFISKLVDCLNQYIKGINGPKGLEEIKKWVEFAEYKQFSPEDIQKYQLNRARIIRNFFIEHSK